MVLEMAGESAFAVVDAFFVARLGSAALAAVGLTESVLEIIYAIAIGLSMSTTAMVARRIGEKNERAAARAAVQAIAVGIATSLILGIAGIIWAPELLRLMGAEPETIALGTTYTRVMYGTMAVIVLLFLNNAIYRGAGDAAMAMRSVWLANAINIVLDPLLIFGPGPFPELGLTGAAVATTIGRGTAVAYQLWGLSGGRRLRVRRADLRLDIVTIRRLLRISAGGVGQLLVSQASYVGLIRMLAGFGSAVLAGYVVAIRVVIFVILPAWGLSNAAATLVGQNLGARKPERAERAVYVTGTWNMLFMAIITVVFVAFAPEIIAPFLVDADSLAAGTSALRIISYGYMFYAWGMVMLQAFNGAGDTATPTKLNFVIFWLFQLPFAWTLSRSLGLGPEGVYWAIAVAYSLSAVVGVFLFRRGRWKEKAI
ncbi:MAG: MATE family efflux transporter [Gemmatimonadota bacterium]|nr:MAG: MATE family efflux transporter [Gemmatimonadota bacterium]